MPAQQPNNQHMRVQRGGGRGGGSRGGGSRWRRQQAATAVPAGKSLRQCGNLPVWRSCCGQPDAHCRGLGCVAPLCVRWSNNRKFSNICCRIVTQVRTIMAVGEVSVSIVYVEESAASVCLWRCNLFFVLSREPILQFVPQKDSSFNNLICLPSFTLFLQLRSPSSGCEPKGCYRCCRNYLNWNCLCHCCLWGQYICPLHTL